MGFLFTQAGEQQHVEEWSLITRNSLQRGKGVIDINLRKSENVEGTIVNKRNSTIIIADDKNKNA